VLISRIEVYDDGGYDYLRPRRQVFKHDALPRRLRKVPSITAHLKPACLGVAPLATAKLLA
jgi:hypothetical protein